jgi:beta-lactamase regulating signal transducer with metallopeptidase domain
MIFIPVLDASANFGAHVLQPAARSLAIACFARLALAAFRVRSVALRLAIWRTVLLLALAMPLLGLLLPPLPVFVPLAAKFVHAQPPAEIAPAREVQSRTINFNQVARSNSTKVGAFSYGSKSSDTTEATSAPQLATTSRATAQPGRPFPWLAASVALYFAVAMFMLIRLALGVILGRRLERESRRIEDAHALARLDFVTRASGLRIAPRLAESDLLCVPVTFGVRSPAILLPADWRDWEPAELDAVLAHEISHVVRRDAFAERLALLHRAIFWFSPLSWWLARHLADLAEEASDDAALAAGADRMRYAETLLGFFAALEAAPGRVWWQGVSMATAGQAEKRVDRILEWKGSVAMRLKKSVVIAYVLLAIPVVCLIAAFRPTIENFHSTPSQQAAPRATQAPAAPAEQSALPPAPPANAPEHSAAPVVAPPAGAPELAPIAPMVSVDIVAPKVSAAPVVAMRAAVAPQVSVAPVVSVHAFVAPVVRVVPIVPVPPVGGPAVSVAPVVHVHPFLPSALQSTTINGTRIADFNDETFAIVSGKSYVSVSSSHTSMRTDTTVGTADSDSGDGFVGSLRQSFPGDFIWFIRGGKAYIIRDPGTIKQAMEFFAPAQALGRRQDELGKQQEALGAQQEALGAKQEALGEQMEKVRVKIPDMTAELEKLQAELKKLGADGTPDDLGRIQEKIGEIQERIGESQSKAGEQQGELGRQQGALGQEQGKLGEQQGKLGELQGKLGEQQEAAAKQAGRNMKKLLDQAIASGLAKPA